LPYLQSQYLVVVAVLSPDGLVGTGAATGDGTVGAIGLPPMYVPAQLPSQLLLLSLHHPVPQLTPLSHVQQPPVFDVGGVTGDCTGDCTGAGTGGTGTGVGRGLLVGLAGLIVISAQFQNFILLIFMEI
jgi:hypothetical protein